MIVSSTGARKWVLRFPWRGRAKEMGLGSGTGVTLADARAEAERRQIISALDHADGQLGAAAKRLEISRTTLWEKMKRLGISQTVAEPERRS